MDYRGMTYQEIRDYENSQIYSDLIFRITGKKIDSMINIDSCTSIEYLASLGLNDHEIDQLNAAVDFGLRAKGLKNHYWVT